VPPPLIISQIGDLFVPIHRDGYKFIAAAAAVTALAFLLSGTLGLLGCMATVALALFFRDPRRVVPVRDGLAIAAADGALISVGLETPPNEFSFGTAPMTRASTFLSIFDVHVVRAPVSGRVVKVFYRPGEHRNAASPQAPALNESFGAVIETAAGAQVGVVLVAGTVARRIVPNIREGDQLCAGERIGIIRFGSRVDIYLPAGTAIVAGEGQRMIAGETVIANFDKGEIVPVFRRI
jgi:phosphatidylserine decarboxylase